MRYEIKGDTLPVVVCYLENGERMITERGSMSWMSPNMKWRQLPTEESEKHLEECFQARHCSRTVIQQREVMG